VTLNYLHSHSFITVTSKQKTRERFALSIHYSKSETIDHRSKGSHFQFLIRFTILQFTNSLINLRFQRWESKCRRIWRNRRYRWSKPLGTRRNWNCVVRNRLWRFLDGILGILIFGVCNWKLFKLFSQVQFAFFFIGSIEFSIKIEIWNFYSYLVVNEVLENVVKS